MVQRLLEHGTVEGAIQTILDDVIALHGAEYGDVQLLSGHDLVIVAQRGLSTDFLKTFRRVDGHDGTACGRALRLGAIVQIADVEQDSEFAAYRIDAKKAGFRSVQSAPFVTTDGKFMCMVSTHFANPHRATAIELDMLKAYRIVAADHVYKLLGDLSLGEKAEQMSEQLYAGTSGVSGQGESGSRQAIF
jgi:hypothetical protein